ncbi:MAG: ARMT1-like domain-containing protein [Planctomycetaceae bacterium]|jgi:uncharacterized protein with ATP-grasp and redox domains|nr:ARMT1-like domain-containing protein [Planctomycetaceae bacterium]
MPISLDCIICLTRQSLEAARFASCDESRHAAVLKRTLELVHDKGFTVIPPLVAQEIQRIVRDETGNTDPYSVPKQEFNDLMLSIREPLRRKIRESADPLRMAVQIAIAGNAIDYAVRGDWSPAMVLEVIEGALKQPINGNPDQFIESIVHSRNILYLLDNCGEIVCDQILMEELCRFQPRLCITAVVRGAAVLNDVTWADVRQVGLDGLVTVIDNGNDAVGTILEQCGAEFQEKFRQADLIIAKGLANYETLIEYDCRELPQTVYYFFKAKCSFIARFAGVQLGDLVIRR